MNAKKSPLPLLPLLALLALLPAHAWARPAQDGASSDRPADYAHALPLTVSGQQGVVGLRLPQSVYLAARSADLADLRLFDASGAKLPFALYLPKPQTRARQQSWPVKRFPLLAGRGQGQSVDGIRLDIKTGADGTLLSVQTKPGEGQALAGLVLEVGRTGAAGAPLPLIGALRFTLPAGRQTYAAQVWLEVSDDLKHWDTVGAAELSWLASLPPPASRPDGAADTQTYRPAILANDRLEFAPRAFRYARLSWRGGEPLDFAEITAESVEQSAEAPALERLALQPVAGREPEDWVYRAGVAIPVEKIELRFREPNVVLPAEIGFYRKLPATSPLKPGAWVFEALARNVFYQITQAGSLRRSGEWPVPLSHGAEWVLRPQTASASRPELVLAWQPATLVFLAGGQAPYTLAFGRDHAPPAAADLGQVAPGFSAQELAQIEQAQAGPLQSRQTAAAGAPGAAETAADAAQGRALILWGVLLAGVAVLAALVWRLIGQMK